jgi:hypothetical protein
MLTVGVCYCNGMIVSTCLPTFLNKGLRAPRYTPTQMPWIHTRRRICTCLSTHICTNTWTKRLHARHANKIGGMRRVLRFTAQLFNALWGSRQYQHSTLVLFSLCVHRIVQSCEHKMAPPSPSYIDLARMCVGRKPLENQNRELQKKKGAKKGYFLFFW